MPYKLDKLIEPEATPAKVRTTVSPRLIVWVLLRPSSVFTFASEIAPDDCNGINYSLHKVFLNNYTASVKIIQAKNFCMLVRVVE